MDKDVYKSRGCCHAPDANTNSNNILQHSCCKLDAYDWLKDIDPGSGNTDFHIIEARFKNSRKEFFYLPEGLQLSEGDIIAVEAQPGHDIAIVTLTGYIVRLQLNKKRISPDSDRIRKVYRKARTSDIEKWLNATSKENDTMIRTRRIVGELGLDMKINDVEYQGDNTKVIFYYTAEGRVDFRKLIKILAEEFRVRIEMKQIGVRQESGRLGGIGSCGRELCCSSWLTNFNSVSTVAARSQQLALNPQKLAGQCGKLKCCLNFEYNSYTEALERFPDSNIRLRTKKGTAYYVKADVFKEIMWYSYEDEPGGLHPVPVDDVHKVIAMNKRNKYPETLEDFAEKKEEESQSFENVIGHDDLDRFDKKKPTGNRSRNNRNNRNQKRKEGGENANQNRPNKERPRNQGDKKGKAPRKEVSGRPANQSQGGENKKPANRKPRPNNPNQQKKNPNQQQNKPSGQRRRNNPPKGKGGNNNPQQGQKSEKAE